MSARRSLKSDRKTETGLGTGQAQDGLGQAQPQIEPTGNELGKDLFTS